MRHVPPLSFPMLGIVLLRGLAVSAVRSNGTVRAHSAEKWARKSRRAASWACSCPPAP